MTKKEQIVAALYAFVNQRPGLEPGNYISGWNDTAGRTAYRAESRRITRDGHIARMLIRQVELNDSILADDIIAASRSAYSGRLLIVTREDGAVAVDYCAGQYWPTEYRTAVCAVMAACLWSWVRDHAMPTPVKVANGAETYGGVSAGTWIRSYFRNRFGANIARRFFD